MDLISVYGALLIVFSLFVIFKNAISQNSAALLGVAVLSVLLWLPVFGRLIHWW